MTGLPACHWLGVDPVVLSIDLEEYIMYERSLALISARGRFCLRLQALIRAGQRLGVGLPWQPTSREGVHPFTADRVFN